MNAQMNVDECDEESLYLKYLYYQSCIMYLLLTFTFFILGKHVTSNPSVCLLNVCFVFVSLQLVAAKEA